MPSYLTPGTYVEEVSTGPQPIAAHGTSTAGFVGIAPRRDVEVDRAVAINSWAQFERTYVLGAKETSALAQAVFGFFDNGGTRCYVVNVADGPVAGGPGRRGVDLFEAIDEIAIVATPGFHDAKSYDAVLSHCEKMQDRVAVLDAPSDVPDIDQLKNVARQAPTKRTAPVGEGAAGEGGGAPKGLRPRPSDRGFGAFYFPWLVARDVVAASATVVVPPSGHVAGIYARVDGQRGVHKAPANEIVRGALDLTYHVTHAEQGDLNLNCVNCLRSFSRRGIRVWGARTLAGAASEWRYVNVRRLFCMLEESILAGTHGVVFEPNDTSLWKRITRDVSAFLMQAWRNGYLVGATPEEAFFVKCDEETNPPEVVNDGQVVILVGAAPARPAEFVVFRIGQHQAGAQVEE